MALVCVPAAFGQAITGFTGGNQFDSYYGSAAGDVVGYQFTVSEQMQVTDLGIWNMDTFGVGGIDNPHEVGIWDGSQNLLGSVVVDNTGTVVGDWIYESITPIILDTGETYTIGALYLSGDDDRYISGASSATTAAEITWLASVYPTAGELGFVFPGLTSTSIGRFGPNFIFDELALEHTTWGSIKATMQ